MSLLPDIADQEIYTAVRAVLLTVLPTGTEIVQGVQNRVPMPKSGWVLMTVITQKRISTNRGQFSDPLQVTVTTMPTQHTVQLDFYGLPALSWATAAQTLFRDHYSTELMPANIQPLYTDDPMHIPLIDGENQWENRWKLDVQLQTNPSITIPTQSATGVTITLASLDANYPPAD